MQTSLLKTLACKYDSSVSKTDRKYAAKTETPHGPRKCLQVIVERGAGRKPLVARSVVSPSYGRRTRSCATASRSWQPHPRRELIDRLLAGRCEICGQAEKVQVHQIRKLSDLDKPGQPDQPEWMRIMAKRRRKTLVVCGACHASIHLGRPIALSRHSHWRAR